MKLQEIIKRVRFTVNEVDTPVDQRNWSDDEIVVYINAGIQDMFIQQVEANESYHNVEFTILNTSDRVFTIGSNISAYTLPYLVHPRRPPGTEAFKPTLARQSARPRVLLRSTLVHTVGWPSGNGVSSLV